MNAFKVTRDSLSRVRPHLMGLNFSSNVLVVNSGSSSIKCQVMNPRAKQPPDVLFNCTAERLNSSKGRLLLRSESFTEERNLADSTHRAAFTLISELVSELVSGGGETLAAVGHRVVHGGSHFRAAAALINRQVLAKIEECNMFAPLHNPHSLTGIHQLTVSFPHLPQVAVFDTSFHQTMPERAFRYAIPEWLYRDINIRKFGFHGNSHRYVVERATEKFRYKGAPLKIVSAHLGSGCSVTASLGGRSLDTSMGLTPLEGLAMGHRSGDVDPAIFQVLRDKFGFSLDRTTDLLNKESGLLGMTGASDMRDVEEMLARGVEAASAAMDVFCYRLAKYVASYVVPLGGLDVLVFTGGIGEKSCVTRARVLELLKPLGFEAADAARNEANGEQSEGVITMEGSDPVAMVVTAHEELIIAEETLRVVQNIGLQ